MLNLTSYPISVRCSLFTAIESAGFPRYFLSLSLVINKCTFCTKRFSLDSRSTMERITDDVWGEYVIISSSKLELALRRLPEDPLSVLAE